MPDLFTQFGGVRTPLIDDQMYSVGFDQVDQGRSRASDVVALHALSRLADIRDATGGAAAVLTTDGGFLIRIDAGVTIPTGLPTGFQFSIQNTAGATQTLTTTGLTLEGDPSSLISANGLIGCLITATNTVLIKGDTE